MGESLITHIGTEHNHSDLMTKVTRGAKCRRLVGSVLYDIWWPLTTMTARPACHDRLILRGLKKYSHVYLRTHDWMTGVKILAGSVTVTPCSSERCFSEHHHVVLTPNVQLSLLPFPLALDLIILIRPWPNRGELSSNLPGQGHYNFLN
jgi:hypothetical protein